MTPDPYDAAVNHYAEVVVSERGRCWWMVYNAEGSGRPTFCTEPVILQGRTKLAGKDGKRTRVWNCDGHREGVEQAERAGTGRWRRPSGRVWQRQPVEPPHDRLHRKNR